MTGMHIYEDTRKLKAVSGSTNNGMTHILTPVMWERNKSETFNVTAERRPLGCKADTPIFLNPSNDGKKKMKFSGTSPPLNSTQGKESRHNTPLHEFHFFHL